MKQGRVLRRYWPFLALVGVQLVLASVAPSTGHTTLRAGQVQLGTVVQPEAPAASAAPGEVTPSDAPTSASVASASTTAPGAVPVPTQGSSAAASTRGSSQTKAGANTSAAAAAANDTSRCAGALQQKVTSQSPPCMAAIPQSKNGGATSPGVTASTITVVLYQAKVNPTVNAVEAGAGLGEDPAKQAVAAAAFTAFFNKHYELAGRQIVLKTFTGTCTVDPPDNDCLRGDARTIVSTLHPFWVLWPTGRPSFFDELSKAGVLNSGGLTFSGAFNRSLAPYHYSAFTSGDRMAKSVAAYWCNRLVGKPASLAGDATLRTQTRKLGILVREEPANEQAAELLASLVSGGTCAGPKPIIITFSQDIATAQEQASTAIAKLRQNGVTTVASISSALELVLQMSGFSTNGYHPENLLVGTGLVDQDAAGRLIDSSQWANAFGLGDNPVQLPADQTDSAKAFRDGGQTGTPYAQAAITFQEMQLMVWQLQAAAGKLDPVDVAKATFSMQVIGDWDGDGHNPYAVRWQVTNDDYSGPDDARQIYWDANATSAADGQKGAYVNVDGGHRYVDGTFPAGDPKKP